MKALYRKYRPTKLEDVVGQDKVTKPLMNALKSGHVSHAYLFTGPRGCGKTSVARIFAHAVNGFAYEVEDSYVDIIEIDAASNTGVDNVRELREKAVIAPTEGKYKIYIIDEVHMLSKSAFNALLKTIEEPPENVIFIMATTDVYKVPITITSRAQVYNFELAPPDVMQKHLQKIAKSEKITIDDDALSVIVNRGGGSFRDTISLLDQISTLKKSKITKSDVLLALGIPNDAVIKNLLTAYIAGDFNAIVEEIKSAIDVGEKPEQLAESLISAIISRPEPKTLPLLEKLPEVKSPFSEAKLILAFLSDAAERPPLYIQTPNSAVPPSQPVTAEEPLEKQPKNTNQNSPNAQPQNNSQQHTEVKFDWGEYLEQIKSGNMAVFSILQKAEHSIQGDQLQIVVERKTHRSILNSDNNRKLLNKFIPNYLKIKIVDSAEKMAKSKKFAKISDIMGEITEVNTDASPF